VTRFIRCIAGLLESGGQAESRSLIPRKLCARTGRPVLPVGSACAGCRTTPPRPAGRADTPPETCADSVIAESGNPADAPQADGPLNVAYRPLVDSPGCRNAAGVTSWNSDRRLRQSLVTLCAHASTAHVRSVKRKYLDIQAISPNVFDALDAEFAASSLGFVTLVEQGECGDGLPERAITVGAARDVVHDPAANLAVCDGVFAALVRRARIGVEHSQLAAIWVMLRACGRSLIASAGRGVLISRTSGPDVVVGFLDALRDADPGRQNLGAHLWWATYRHGRRRCEKFIRETAAEDIATLAARTATADHANNPPAEPGYPGAVDAVSPISPVADSRVEGERLGSIAHRFGLHSRLPRGHRTWSRRHRISCVILHHTNVRSRSRAVGGSAAGIERQDDVA
jgi:hypothetical protein